MDFIQGYIEGELIMASFLDDITPFLGENTANDQGLMLPEFLEQYDPNQYPNPSVTADVMVFWAKDELKDVTKDLRLLLIRRKNHPSIGWWALPGGFVDIREDADLAAKRELEEETGITGISVEQLCAWGDYNRDPRTRIVTIAYLALLENVIEVKAGDDAQDAGWFDVKLQLIREELKEERKVKVYQLELVNTEKGERASATVAYSFLPNRILQDEKYEVLNRDHLAFDHPSFIVKGLLHLQNRLNTL